MRRSRKQLALAGVLSAFIGAVAAVAFAGSAPDLTGVPSANTRSAGYAPASVLSPELAQIVVAQGSYPLDGGTAAVPYYGYLGGAPMVPALGSNVEAKKTEPDKNTYLVFQDGLPAPTRRTTTAPTSCSRATRAARPGTITRINLDADAAHRVTLLATKDADGNDLATIDGSTWDPWAKLLLFTTESAERPDVRGHARLPLHRHATSRARSDAAATRASRTTPPATSGSSRTSAARRRRDEREAAQQLRLPLRARHPSDLRERQAPGAAGARRRRPSDHHVVAGRRRRVRPRRPARLRRRASTPAGSTIHNTASDGTAPFNANTLAKAANGTPFKRPENGVFRPDGKFKEFFFDETGDTNATSTENGCCGGWGSIYKLTQKSPTADSGTLSIFYNGDGTHAAFDNVSFFDKDHIAFVEDAGATLHQQRNGLDNAWMFDVTKDYSNPANQPVRFIAEGRDPSATIDAGLVGTPGFNNEDDNEITGHPRLERRSEQEWHPRRQASAPVEGPRPRPLARLLHAAAR